MRIFLCAIGIIILSLYDYCTMVVRYERDQHYISTSTVETKQLRSVVVALAELMQF